MQALSDNHIDFSLRMQRIEAMARARVQMLYVGVDESYLMPRRVHRVKTVGLLGLMANAAYPVSLALAPLVGLFAHGLGMVLRFQINRLKGWSENPDIEMVAQVVIGFGLAMVLGYLMGLRSNQLTSLKAVGVVLGLLFFHDAVHLYPEVFAHLTSPLWVSQMLAQTKAHSLLWRGISIVL